VAPDGDSYAARDYYTREMARVFGVDREALAEGYVAERVRDELPRTPGFSLPPVPGTAHIGPGRGGTVVYWVYAEPHGDGTTNTAVARGTLVEGFTPHFEDVQVIYRQAPRLRSTAHYAAASSLRGTGRSS
jgi:hypothetical protein